jgi:DinB family protein
MAMSISFSAVIRSGGEMSDPRYPIGKFTFDGSLDETQRKQFISDIEQTPRLLRAAVTGLSQQQLDTPYRDGGWTVRQVVHHVPESHMNAYIRFKLALTEDEPTIKPYMEDVGPNFPMFARRHRRCH